MKPISLIVALIFFYSNVIAQIDTIITKKGDIYPCTIIGFDDENINTLDPHEQKLIVNLALIKSAFFDGYGQIYSSDSGYLVSIDTLEQALKRRQEIIEKANELSDRIMKGKEVVTGKNWENEKRPKFSFGIFYIPNSLEKQIIHFDDNSNMYSTIEEYSPQIESQFSFNLHKRLYLTFNFAYNSAFIKNKNVVQELNTNPVNTNNYGSESEQTLKLFTVELGFKYYLIDLFSNKVSAYVLAGIGKTFAWAKDEKKYLFQEVNPNNTIINNRSEYLEDLSSPFLFQVGFGTEYFFNNYLSVHSSIKLYYSTISANYNEKITYENYQRTEKREINKSDLVTKVGIGLNFYL